MLNKRIESEKLRAEGVIEQFEVKIEKIKKDHATSKVPTEEHRNL